MKTSKAIELFIASRRARDVKPKSIADYLWVLSKVEEKYPDALPATEMEINDFFSLHAHLSEASRENMRVHMRAFWKWLHRNHLVANNPMRDIKRKGRPTRHPVTLDVYDIARLFDAALSERDYILLNLFLDTGVRLAEATSITRDRINESKGHVTVTGKVGDRIVPVSQGVIDGMLRISKGPYVWTNENTGKRLRKSGVRQVVTRCMVRGGLPKRKLGPHILRHTFGLQYVLNGGDPFSLKEIMGHASITTTMLYVYMAYSQSKDQHSKYSPVANMIRTGDYATGLAAARKRQRGNERFKRGARKAGEASGKVRRAKSRKMRAKARRLRSKGMSPNDIANMLECNVRSVSRYLAD